LSTCSPGTPSFAIPQGALRSTSVTLTRAAAGGMHLVVRQATVVRSVKKPTVDVTFVFVLVCRPGALCLDPGELAATGGGKSPLSVTSSRCAQMPVEPPVTDVPQAPGEAVARKRSALGRRPSSHLIPSRSGAGRCGHPFEPSGTTWRGSPCAPRRSNRPPPCAQPRRWTLDQEDPHVESRLPGHLPRARRQATKRPRSLGHGDGL